MKKLLQSGILLLAFCAQLKSQSVNPLQKLELTVSAGISNYQGDLQPIFFTFQQSKPAVGAAIKYGLTSKLFIRSGFMIGGLSGDDLGNKKKLVDRNLRFKSPLQEFHLAGEYRLLKENNKLRLVPYVFAGLGVYRFNPYTYYKGTKVYLQPLGTEGQGLSQYSQKKKYSLTQLCLQYGLGYNYQLNNRITVGVEFCQRKLFTDYLDDASGTFADKDVLFKARGQVAVDLAYPSKLLNPTTEYPKEGALRANPNANDWYYTGQVTLTLRMFDENSEFSLGGFFSREKRSHRLSKKQLHCPTGRYL